VDTSQIDVDAVLAAVADDELVGFCTRCGAEAYNVETDARGYPCESCGARTVYGAGELLLHLAS
jgi:hypothetical protein